MLSIQFNLNIIFCPSVKCSSLLLFNKYLMFSPFIFCKKFVSHLISNCQQFSISLFSLRKWNLFRQLSSWDRFSLFMRRKRKRMQLRNPIFLDTFDRFLKLLCRLSRKSRNNISSYTNQRLIWSFKGSDTRQHTIK